MKKLLQLLALASVCVLSVNAMAAEPVAAYTDNEVTTSELSGCFTIPGFQMTLANLNGATNAESGHYALSKIEFASPTKSWSNIYVAVLKQNTETLDANTTYTLIGLTSSALTVSGNGIYSPTTAYGTCTATFENVIVEAKETYRILFVTSAVATEWQALSDDARSTIVITDTIVNGAKKACYGYSSELVSNSIYSTATVMNTGTTPFVTYTVEKMTGIWKGSETSPMTWNNSENWEGGFVPTTGDVEIALEASTAITVDSAVNLNVLSVGMKEGVTEASLTLSGTEVFAANTTTVNADTDVSGLTGTVNLGAVTVAANKTLAVGKDTTFTLTANNGTLHIASGTADDHLTLNQTSSLL